MQFRINKHTFAPLALIGALCGTALAQEAPPPSIPVSYAYDTGWVENRTSTRIVTISFTVYQPQAEWMRLYFQDVNLGRNPQVPGQGSILRMTAFKDGAVQEMNTTHVDQWQKSSAYFNGESVQVEVLADPGTRSRLVMRALDMGLAPADDPSQCGSTDDRVPSSDPRAARLLPIGCTGWMINDCAHCFLTAGHCTSGVSVAQFNVPNSNSGGGLNNPPPKDQYAVDSSSIQSNGGQGVGNDWGYFGTFPNSTTGLTAYQAQGSAFNVVNPPGTSNNTIRITGYGVDSGVRNQTQQTHVGPFVNSSGTTVGYVTDTQGGNSGSPVIWEQSGDAVGIHTHGGCSSTGGNNWGTGANHGGLQNAISSPKGVCASGNAIFSDGFESGDYLTGSWVVQNKKAKIRKRASKTGNWGARLKRKTWIERAVDTTGLSNIAVSYWRKTKNLIAGERMRVQWWNGSNWTTLEDATGTSWGQATFSLPSSADNNSNFKIRFRTNSNQNKGWGDVDDVTVASCN
ncbi:MAG TPA: hypothetical protein EYQ74_15370 [Planctomycetes bacterium]|nr:hypothetical protein [Planctomycetota bacterium]HIK59065.1 hypothetical protein [Planctomycetota bacterium]